MGRVRLHTAALAQRLEDELHIALLQIADGAVHELRAAARGTFRKVGHFESRYAVPARRGVDRNSEAGGPAPYDNDVPLTVRIFESFQ